MDYKVIVTQDAEADSDKNIGIHMVHLNLDQTTLQYFFRADLWVLQFTILKSPSRKVLMYSFTHAKMVKMAAYT